MYRCYFSLNPYLRSYRFLKRSHLYYSWPVKTQDCLVLRLLVDLSKKVLENSLKCTLHFYTYNFEGNTFNSNINVKELLRSKIKNVRFKEIE